MLAGITLVLTACGPVTIPHASPRPSAPASGAGAALAVRDTLHIVTIRPPIDAARLGFETGQVAGGGLLWLAIAALSPGPPIGAVVGVNPATGAVVAQWAGSGSPAGLTWANGTLWELGNRGDLSAAYAYANQLIGLAPATGQLRARVSVPSVYPPYGVAVYAGTVYVLGNIQGSASELWKLVGNQLVAVRRLPGTQPGAAPYLADLAVCGGSLYAMTITVTVPNITQLFRLALPSLRPVEQWRLPQGLGLICAPGGVVVAQPTSAPQHGLIMVRQGVARPSRPFGPVSLPATLFFVGHTLWVPTLVPPLAPRPITEVRTYAWPSGQSRGTYHLPGGTIAWAAPTGADTFWYASFETGAQLGTFLPPVWRQVTIGRRR